MFHRHHQARDGHILAFGNEKKKEKKKCVFVSLCVRQRPREVKRLPACKVAKLACVCHATEDALQFNYHLHTCPPLMKPPFKLHQWFNIDLVFRSVICEVQNKGRKKKQLAVTFLGILWKLVITNKHSFLSVLTLINHYIRPKDGLLRLKKKSVIEKKTSPIQNLQNIHIDPLAHPVLMFTSGLKSSSGNVSLCCVRAQKPHTTQKKKRKSNVITGMKK